MADTQFQQARDSVRAVRDGIPEVMVHADESVDVVRVWFEVPAALADRVYARGRERTFCDLLEELLDATEQN